jgi:hybrid polyketide synthase/nonribosomal peptide synthetase ACE1
MLKAVEIADGVKGFVSIGRQSPKEELYVVVTNSLALPATAPRSWMFPVGTDLQTSQQTLLCIYANLVAQAVLANTKSGTIVVLDPGEVNGKALNGVATQRAQPLLLLTTDQTLGRARPWLYVHPNATRRSIERILPADTAIFIDMGPRTNLSSLVPRCTRETCRNRSFESFFSDRGQLERSSIGNVRDQLENALVQCNLFSISSTAVPHLLGVGDLIKTQTVSFRGLSMVDWTQQAVPVRIKPASKEVSFSPDRTYWLVGLKGGLGETLSRWMADRGARHIALSSRNPSASTFWQQELASHGCTVRSFARYYIQILDCVCGLTTDRITAM